MPEKTIQNPSGQGRKAQDREAGFLKKFADKWQKNPLYSTGAVLIVKTERKFFQMIKNIPSHILLNAGPKNVAPVSNKPVTSFMNAKAHKKQGNKNQKSLQLKIRNQRVQCITRKHREGNINCSHKNSTRHVSGKELPVRLVVREENFKRAF